MQNSVGQEAHWKTITEEHLVEKRDSVSVYKLIFDEPKVFGSPNYPIELTIELKDTWDKKVSSNTGNEYQVAGVATISIFNQLQETMMFGGKAKSGKLYANASFGEDHEKRLHEEREVSPVGVTLLQDNPGHTFAEIRKATLSGTELPKSKSTWKVILTETWTADEIDTSVEDDIPFGQETESTTSVDRDSLKE